MLARDCNYGDVIKVDLDPSKGREQAKTRPCVVVQTPTMRFAQTTIILPIADGSVKKNFPFIVPVPKDEGGLTKDSHILAHQIRVISEERIVERLGSLSQRTMVQVIDALKFVLNME